MTREIKFRYQSRITGKMVYSTQYGLFHDFWDDCNQDSVRGTVGQYTGINDKNGKEIYEGDIVQTTHKIRVGTIGPDRKGNTFAQYSDRTENGVVIYKGGKWLVEFNSQHNYLSYFFCKSKRDLPERRVEDVVEELPDRHNKYEVIGNIYENTELLNG